MSNPFNGLVAVVTGAGSGIGLSVAKALAADGARVFGLDLHEGEMAGHATFIRCDVGQTLDVEAAFKKIAESTSSIDLVFNIAGIGAIGTVEVATDEEWSRVLNVNVVGTSRVSAAALPFLRKSSCASIVNTSSIAASAGLPARAVYSASKGAVQSLTLAMAADFIDENIRVNCVNPGTANTPWVKRLLSQSADPAAELKALEARQPMGRLVEPEEVAQAMLFLASPLQASTTGAVLAIDGGMQGLRLRKK